MRTLPIARPAAVWFASLALAAAPAARADTDRDPGAAADFPVHRDEISLGGGARALRSPSANALTAANLAGASVGIARDLGRDLGLYDAAWPLHQLTLWAEAGFVTGAADGTLFQTLSTTIDQLGFTAGVAARYRVHRRVALGVRGALGAQRARVAITDGSGSSAYDHGWGTLAQASAALDLFLTTRPHFGLGVRLDAGYVAAQGIALTLHSDRSDDAMLLAMRPLSLGHLDLSGPTAAISLVAQF